MRTELISIYSRYLKLFAICNIIYISSELFPIDKTNVYTVINLFIYLASLHLSIFTECHNS